MNDDDELAGIVWDYMLMKHELVGEFDVILCLCSNDVRVAHHAASLWKNGFSKLLMFSGNSGELTAKLFGGRPEAEVFAEEAQKIAQVPRASMLMETKSTNTGQNISFSKAMLEEHGVRVKRLLLVQKPFMERRSYATFMRQWPGAEEMEIRVSSPSISLAQYPNAILTRHDIFCVMCGDLQRIREYPKRGFQIPMDIPDKVWAAFETLVARGFNSHLL